MKNRRKCFQHVKCNFGKHCYQSNLCWGLKSHKAVSSHHFSSPITVITCIECNQCTKARKWNNVHTDLKGESRWPVHRWHCPYKNIQKEAPELNVQNSEHVEGLAGELNTFHTSRFFCLALPWDMKAHLYNDLHTSVHVHFLVRAPTWKQINYPKAEWRNKLWCTHSNGRMIDTCSIMDETVGVGRQGRERKVALQSVARKLHTVKFISLVVIIFTQLNALKTHQNIHHASYHLTVPLQ